MITLVDTKNSGIDIRKWLGSWLEIIAEGDVRMKGWVFEHRVGERMKIHDIDRFSRSAKGSSGSRSGVDTGMSW